MQKRALTTVSSRFCFLHGLCSRVHSVCRCLSAGWCRRASYCFVESRFGWRTIRKPQNERVSAVNTTVANMRPTTADNSGDIVKPTDLWIEVNGMPTRVLCWGQPLEEEISNSRDLKKLILCVCGNPGITEFYEKFLLEVYKSLRVPVWVISHAGHEIPPSNIGIKNPDPKKYPHLYTLKGQVEHKLCFIEKYIPDNCDLYLIGHSIGSKIISEMLKDSEMSNRVSIKRSVFLFPTIQKMRETPNGRKLIFTTSNLFSITLFLSWIFTIFPSFIKKFLVNITLIIMEGRRVDDHIIRSSVNLVHPVVLRNVFSMALDEMNVVYDLDTEPLKNNSKKLHMYFGNCDGWCPTSFYDDVRVRVPDVDAVLCDKGYYHAYVIHHSEEIADITVKWLKPDLDLSN